MNDHDGVYTGNAGKDAALDRGWLLGHFKDAGDVRHSEAVEIKWGVHPRGDERALWVRVGAERDHSWVAEEDSVVLTVRWPSVPGYAVPDGV
jgi:hypothetical protein